MLLDKTQKRPQVFLEKANDYSLAVVKFNLPADALDSYNVTNTSDYRVMISSPANPAGPMVECWGSSSLPISQSSGGTYRYKNNEQVLEAVNRSFLSAYRDYLQAFSDVIADSSYKNYKSISGSFNNSVSSAPFVQTQTINVPSNNCTGRLGYLRFTIRLTDYQGGLEPVQLSLTSPSGKVCQLINNISTSGELIFEDASLNSISEVTNTTPSESNGNFPAGTYQPVESFVKFNDGNSSFGNWTLTIKSTDFSLGGGRNFYVNCLYTLETWFLPKSTSGQDMNLLQYAPSVQVDRSTNLLQLYLHASFFTGGTILSLTPKLYQDLGFDGVLNSSSTYYRITLPQVVIPSPVLYNSFITYTQPVSSLYRLTMIRQILIKSSTLPIAGEFNAVSSQNIIMSIDIPSTSAKDNYEFAPSLYRFYDLINDVGLDEINIQVWIAYDDNTEKLAAIPPYSVFNMLLMFVKTTSTLN
jgi:hypothetical protein